MRNENKSPERGREGKYVERKKEHTHTNLFVFSFLIYFFFILSSSEVFYYPSMLSGVDLLVTNGGFLHVENHTQTCTHTRSL